MEKKKFQSLEEISQGRNNNLNFIRLIAAIMVIFSHSFPISGGGGDRSIHFINRWTSGIGSSGSGYLLFLWRISDLQKCVQVKNFSGIFSGKDIKNFSSIVYDMCNTDIFCRGSFDRTYGNTIFYRCGNLQVFVK